MYPEHAPTDSDEATKFWTQNCVQPAPTFAEELAELEQQPRNNLLARSTLNGMPGNSVEFHSEGDAMRNLASFIDTAQSLLQGYDDSRALEARELLQAMSERFFFLGTPRYEQACQGIAKAWEQHLTAHPDGVINVSGQPENATAKLRSHNQVPFAIAERVDPALRERVITNPEDWEITEYAKLIAADDWAISGATAAQIASDAVFNATGQGKKALADQLELHLLAGTYDQLGTDFTSRNGGGRVFPGIIRSYFVMPPRKRLAMNHWGMLVSGAHSSADYAFELPLSGIRVLLQDRGHDIDLPHLTYLKRSYRD